LGENNYVSIVGIYLSADGSKLVVLGNQYAPYIYAEKMPYATGFYSYISPYLSGSAFVHVYDLADKAAPVLARNFTMSGWYVNSRMIGNYVYGIFTENAYLIDDTVILPEVYSGTETLTIAADQIYYNNLPDTYYSYTTIAGINVMDDGAAPSELTIMMGGAGTMYVSANNIYVTYPATDYKAVPLTVRAQETGPVSSAATGSVSSDVIVPPSTGTIETVVWQGTQIYKIHVAEGSLTFTANGNVTGNVLNQYSMDESDGYFRIATTSHDYTPGSYSVVQQNNLYVLNSNLEIVGKIENLASGENLHAARFMGDRCYLVTFMNTDPLFVIDLSKPTNPQVLGNLTMPGYSDYLYPYDATHLIGLGKDTVETGSGFAWYQGLKLSLFDVSDVTAPKEVSRFIIGDRGTSSEALYDPKAFLFDPSRNLLVLPVELYLVNADTTPSPDGKEPTPVIPPSISSPTFVVGRIGSGSSSSAYGQFVWQGAYALNVDLTNGFTMKGNVTQIDYSSPNPNGIYYYRNDYWITRALYIDNTLYTLSNSRVQLNDINSFDTLVKVELR